MNVEVNPNHRTFRCTVDMSQHFVVAPSLLHLSAALCTLVVCRAKYGNREVKSALFKITKYGKREVSALFKIFPINQYTSFM